MSDFKFLFSVQGSWELKKQILKIIAENNKARAGYLSVYIDAETVKGTIFVFLTDPKDVILFEQGMEKRKVITTKLTVIPDIVRNSASFKYLLSL